MRPSPKTSLGRKPLALRRASRSGMSSPFGSWRATWTSENPTMRCPSSCRMRARLPPTTPAPWITMSRPLLGLSPRWRPDMRRTKRRPWATASSWPWLPPISAGLPTTVEPEVPWVWPARVSSAQAIRSESSANSGVMTSRSGPMSPMRLAVQRRTRRSSSARDSSFRGAMTPPAAPPKGIPRRPHFQLIHAARARSSTSFRELSMRKGPMKGPRPALCWILKPS